MSHGDSLQIRPARTRRDIADWLCVPCHVFAGDPAWAAPLERLERRRISKKHNSFFTHGEAEFFVAYIDGTPVGRISAQVNRKHLQQHGDQTGHFGFFETIDDQAVADALLGAARDWLRARGMARMSGPFNLSVNEECGILVEGFDLPVASMMPRSPRWQSKLLEQAGFAVDADLHSYRMSAEQSHRVIARIDHLYRHSAPVTVRSFDVGNYDSEMALVIDIYNDAWEDHWNFVPFSKADTDYLFGELRMFFKSRYAYFAYMDGKPAAFLLWVPDINGIVRDFDGRLFPFNWMKLVYALSFGTFRSARAPLMGIRREYKGSSQSGMLFAALLKKLYIGTRANTFDWCDLSWVLSSNRPLISFMRRSFGEPAQIHRIFTRAIND